MVPIAAQQMLKGLKSGALLLDRQGRICAHNEEWFTYARILDLPCRRHYLHSYYPALFKHIPGMRAKIWSSLKNPQANKQGISVPGVPLEIHISQLSGQWAGLLVQHVESRGNAFLTLSAHEVFNAFADGMALMDSCGKVVHHNPAMEKLLGPALPFFLFSGTLPKGYSLVSESGDVQEESPFVRVWRQQKNVRTTLVLQSDTGHQTWLRFDARFVRKKSLKMAEAYVGLTDISREKRSEIELITARERLQLAVDGADMGIWDWVPGEGVVVWSHKMYQLFGADSSSNQPAGKIWRAGVHPEDLPKIEAELKRCLSQKRDVRADFRVVTSEGEVKYIRAQARVIVDGFGNARRIVGVNWDVSNEVAAEKRLQTMAYTDALTGLANRTTFTFRLNRAIARALRRRSQIAVLMLDLDNFKDINDNFGHLTGDDILNGFVERILPLIRERDTFARIAGDEFAVVVESLSDAQEAILLAQRLLLALQEPLYIERGPAINVYMSVGVAVYPEDGVDSVAVLKAADLAMYASKRKGGNTISTFSPAMASALNRKVALEYLLRKAVREEIFELYYQPIVQLSTGRVTGCEALIRWQDSTGKFIPPIDFIPLAEDCGLIPEIGRWVLETAFKQWLLWRRLDHQLSYVSVNVSPQQLQDTDFSTELIAMAVRFGINPCHIQLEITEGTFLHETKNAGTHLEKLVEAGFRLAIDDFGTGYSSLAYLKRFDVDVIKIDRSFVREIETSQTDREIVNAILAMTQNLRFQTLVEGVENVAQQEIVTRLGCEYAQGYLFGRPTFADEFAESFLKG